MLYYTILCYIILYYIILYHIILYYTILYYIKLYIILLYSVLQKPTEFGPWPHVVKRSHYIRTVAFWSQDDKKCQRQDSLFETNSKFAPDRPSRKERIVFQPSIFRGENAGFREGNVSFRPHSKELFTNPMWCWMWFEDTKE